MKDALARSSLAELAAAARRPMLLAFDLDGTLAPIVSRPDEARVPDDMQKMLAVLSVRNPVAIITGRAARDARRMLWFAPRYVVGNHGAEGVPGLEGTTEAHAAHCRTWLADVRASPEASATPGILIEDKTYSLSVHYRLAREPQAARRLLLELAARLSPLPRIVEGKLVVNLLPADAPNKGEALRALMAHAGVATALYMGDDVTDEDVFALAIPNVHTIRVEPNGPTAAEFALPRQTDVSTLLRELVRIMHGPAAPLSTGHAA